MTTIQIDVDSKTVWTDSQITNIDSETGKVIGISYGTGKVFHYTTKKVVAATGQINGRISILAPLLSIFRVWIPLDLFRKEPKCDIVVVTKDNVKIYRSNKIRPLIFDKKAQVISLGSGGKYAERLRAKRGIHGKSAIKYAMCKDPFSGGEVREYKL